MFDQVSFSLEIAIFYSSLLHRFDIKEFLNVSTFRYHYLTNGGTQILLRWFLKFSMNCRKDCRRESFSFFLHSHFIALKQDELKEIKSESR